MMSKKLKKYKGGRASNGIMFRKVHENLWIGSKVIKGGEETVTWTYRHDDTLSLIFL
jgi:hypothetical protein